MQNQNLVETQLLTNLANHNYHLYRPYRNNPSKNIAQSSVSIVFRSTQSDQLKDDHQQYTLQKQEYLQMMGNKFPPNKLPLQILSSYQLKNLEILFIQRSVNAKDIHSGQIAFPGGKCDGDEIDFEAAIRETIEEVGLNLFDRNLKTFYLKQIDDNVYVRKTSKGSTLYCTYHVFLLFDPEKLTNELKISESEVQAFKWVPLSLFYNRKPPIFLYKDESLNTIALSFKGYLGKKVMSLAQKNYDYSIYPKMNITMNSSLFGLSFYFLVNIFTLMTHDKPDQFLRKVEGLEEITTLATVSQFKFKDKFILGKPISLIAEYQFKKFRKNIIKIGIQENNPYYLIMFISFILIVFSIMKARL